MNGVIMDTPPLGAGGGFLGDDPRARTPGGGEPGFAEPRPAPAENRGRRFGQAGRSPGRMESEPPGPPRPLDSEEFYTRTVRPLLATMVTVARRILGDEGQAWDPVQEALISLWLEDEMPPNPRAWLVRAVVLRSLHQARTQARRRRHEVRAGERRSETSERDEPSRRLEREELSRALNEALAEIPAEYREVFSLKAVDRMDYASIAEALQIPLGTVRSRLSRSRRALREILLRTMPDEDHGFNLRNGSKS